LSGEAAEPSAASVTAPAASLVLEPKLSPGDLDKFDAYIQTYLRQHTIPGVAVSVIHGTNVVFAKGYGEGITQKTPFILASLSKSFTAIAIMQLVESGKLDLESPVRRYLPWFQVADAEASGKITLRHLLHHVSGISTRAGRLDASGAIGVNAQSLVRWYRQVRLTAAPGTRFQYSNANYNILGAVVEAVSGLEFGAYIQTNIFDPLQMNSSFVSIPEARRHGLLGYRYWFGHPVAYGGEAASLGSVPCGGLVSTVEDLAHYMTVLLNGGRYQGRSILSEAGVETLFRKYGDGPGAGYYAMGWGVYFHAGFGVKIISHDGAAPEFFSLVSLLPDQQVGIAFLANAMSYTSDEVPELGNSLASVLLGKPPPQKAPVNWLVFCATWLLLLLPFVQGISLWRELRLLRKWHVGTPPPGTLRDWVRYWGLPLLAYAIVAGVTLWLLPSTFDLTLWRLMVFVPDYGTLAIFSGVFALVWGMFRSVLVGRLLLQRAGHGDKAVSGA
jgi:CubicO group peptidase (beta-lactamase class C family)